MTLHVYLASCSLTGLCYQVFKNPSLMSWKPFIDWSSLWKPFIDSPKSLTFVFADQKIDFFCKKWCLKKGVFADQKINFFCKKWCLNYPRQQPRWCIYSEPLNTSNYECLSIWKSILKWLILIAQACTTEGWNLRFKAITRMVDTKCHRTESPDLTDLLQMYSALDMKCHIP